MWVWVGVSVSVSVSVTVSANVGVGPRWGFVLHIYMYKTIFYALGLYIYI